MVPSRLREARKTAKLSLDELAARYNEKVEGGGLNKSTLSKYENGHQQPLSKVVSNLAEILNVSVDFLVGKQVQTDFLSMFGIPGLGSPVHDFTDPDTQWMLEIINYADCVSGEGKGKVLEYLKDLYSSDKYRIKEVRRRQDETENGGDYNAT